MRAATVEWPAARHREAAGSLRCGEPERRPHAGGDEVGVIADQFLGHRGVEPGEERRAIADHDGPAGRAVGAADLLEDLRGGGRVEFEATQGPRQVEPEQPARPGPAHQVAGHRPQLLALGGPGPELREQGCERAPQRVVAARGHTRRIGHGSSSAFSAVQHGPGAAAGNR